MESQFHEELLVILQNSFLEPEAKVYAFEYLLDFSADEDGLHQIIACQKYIPFLLKYIEDSGANRNTLELAHSCLMNISANQEGASTIINSKEDLILLLLNKICDEDYQFIDYSCAMLSNLATCSEILKQKDFTTDSSLLDKLLKNLFCSEKERRHKYDFLAFYFAAISGYPERMSTLINNENFVTSFIHHINLEEHYVRRMGVALTLRNLCSEISIHKLLIEKGVLSILLLPLMGPEEYEEEDMIKLPLDCRYLESSKQREPDPQIRRALIQALSLLCYTEDGWNCLITHSVYSVIRDLHKWETDPTTQEAAETLVGFLLVEQYGEINTAAGGNQFVTPSVTEIVKNIPDYITF